jgi:eukaryotic-like serine/threonine-protein kinase
MAAILTDRPRQFVHAGPLAPTLTALLTKPPGGRPGIPETRQLLQPLAGSPNASTLAEFPVDPGAQAPARSGAQPAAYPGIQPAAYPGSQPPAEAGAAAPTPSGAPPAARWGAPPPAHPGTPAQAHSGAPAPVDPGVRHPPGPVPGPPEGERSPWGGWGQAGFHSPCPARPATRGRGWRWTRWCGGRC